MGHGGVALPIWIPRNVTRADVAVRRRILCVVGTRPEIIKMAPVIRALRECSWVDTSVLATAQHQDLSAPLLRFFQIKPDRVLDVMHPRQSLNDLTARLLQSLPSALHAARPDMVLAQGDTTTVMATALACFHEAIPFGHVEAGLRTGNLRDPFPEEFNRVVTGRLARLNFAPTVQAGANLLHEGADPARVFVTGNTGIDALQHLIGELRSDPMPLDAGQRLLLVTLHRRENLGAPMQRIFAAVRQLVQQNADLVVLYPTHPNPAVCGPARDALGGLERVRLGPALNYPELIAAMRQSHLILTDSGGIQEEAPSLGRPVLITREVTERPEAVASGAALLVGTKQADIVAAAQHLLDDPAAYARMAQCRSPFGDGKASPRIVGILRDYFADAQADVAEALATGDGWQRRRQRMAARTDRSVRGRRRAEAGHHAANVP